MINRGEKTQIIAGAIAFIPYLLIAWGGAQLLDVTFVKALSWLIGVRLLFTLVETAGSSLAWRLHGRRKAIEGFLEVLRDNNFPKRKHRRHDFLSFLTDIDQDFVERKDVQARAREMYLLLEVYESCGILPGMRMHSASDAALEIYSPKAEAPE